MTLSPQVRTFDLPPQFKSGRRGSCVPAVITLLPGLDAEDFVIEGYVRSGQFRHEHTWLEVAGIVLDPTIEQFRSLACWRDLPMQYEVKERYPVAIYRTLVAATMSIFWRSRIASFGGSVNV